MSSIGKNIRKIRTVKGLSQAAFAEIFEIKRANIGAYEEGRAEPKLDLSTRIANHFSIPLEVLLTKEITVNQLAGFAPFSKGWNSESISSMTNTAAEDQPPVVRVVLPHEVQRYCRHYNEEAYLATLAPLQMPFPIVAATRALEVRGHEMAVGNAGLQHGDLVFGEPVPTKEWKQLPENHRYVWVLEDTIIIRRLHHQGSSVELQADHPDHGSEKLSWKLVKEVWRINGVLQLQPESSNGVEELMNRMARLEASIQELKAGK